MSETRIADVGLVLEGTYPYVSGGVSSWVHTLISELDHLTFSILHIGPCPDHYPNGPVYRLPENVISHQDVYLKPSVNAQATKKLYRPLSNSKQGFGELHGWIRALRDGDLGAFSKILACVRASECEPFSTVDLLRDSEAWRELVRTYREEAPGENFLKFFWTWLYAHLPLLDLLRGPLPQARMYHTACTGYAGWLASALKLIHRRPMILTEHGIYSKERRIEINQARWIADEDPNEVRGTGQQVSYFERFWIQQFNLMSRVCYYHADSIYTLYDENNKMQVRDGANPEKVQIIPNGIDIDLLQETYEEHRSREKDEVFTVGFVGRVAPVKDIHTLLRAARLVVEEVPKVRFRILGPMIEDEDYAQACIDFAQQLGLDGIASFEGPVDTTEEMAKIDVLALTSISEAQPLVILEAGAVGIPVVATDVGSCSELLFGRSLQDRAIGRGGLVAPIASPGEFAKALVWMHNHPEERKRMGVALRSRVERYYVSGGMINAYGRIYDRFSQEKVA